MQAHTHPRGGICLPTPISELWGFAPLSAIRRFWEGFTRFIQRHGSVARLALYIVAGVLAGTIGRSVGLSPAESIGLGLNVAATVAAFWPPRRVRRRITRRRAGGR
ncbi:hypothetical protein ACFWJT_23210 [Streptomyces sp. NPDC127069]|uniref:hypothetical protein n=1 Tax=Streptomyces sp. NPDC127069 TaxID=3347128 RepID=UPI00364FF005